MIRSIYIGITGLKTFQESLSVTSNNIANSQTIGYKGQKASFEDLFYNVTRPATKSSGDYAGVNPMAIGSGVRMSGVSTNMTQGSINNTGGKTDVAIEGNGYFMVGNSRGESVEYTRKGSFKVSDYLITEGGQYVLGWSVDPLTGELGTNDKPMPLKIPMDEAIQGKATTKAAVSGNLDYDLKVGESKRIQFPSYDNAGKRNDIALEFTRKDATTFYYVGFPTDALTPSESIKNAIINADKVASYLQKGEYQINVTPPVAPSTQATVQVLAPDGSTVLTQMVDNIDQTITLNDGTNDFMTIDFKTANAASTATVVVGDVGEVKFNDSGRVENVASNSGGAPRVDFTSLDSGQPVAVNIDFSKITNFATDSSVNVTEFDGNAASSIRDFAISDDGVISGQYSDGSIRVLGLISLATFDNNEGLLRNGKGNYLQSVASGEPRIVMSGDAGVGRIRATSLESSNVDLSQEFVDLMIYQKSFQANTKIIQVSDEVVSGVINLIRG